MYKFSYLFQKYKKYGTISFNPVEYSKTKGLILIT